MHLKSKYKKLILLVICTFGMVGVILLICFSSNALAVAASIDLGDIPNINITLKYQGHSFVYNSCQHLPNITTFTQQRVFQKNNRTGTHLDRANMIDKMIGCKLPIDDVFCYMFGGWKEYYAAVKKTVNVAPQDAVLNFNPNKPPFFEVKKEVIGCKLNDNDVLCTILKEMHNTDNIVVNLKPQLLLPNVYYDSLIKQTSKLSSFSTSYQTSSEDRKNNIKLALKNFNGMQVMPKQTISFNSVTGERTVQKGYKTAHMIMEGEYIDAIGGGVCQASTTLYNALLLSGVDIDEVHSHSLPSSYVALGFDAMVNFGTSDLRFTNQYDTPIYIRVVCTNERVRVDIYGQNYSQNIKTKTKTEVLSVLPPPNDKVIVDNNGEYIDIVEYKDESFYKKQAQNGYKVNAYLEYYANNKLKKRKLLRTVTYKPQQGIKIFGAKNRLINEQQNNEFLQTLSNILGKY